MTELLLAPPPIEAQPELNVDYVRHNELTKAVEMVRNGQWIEGARRDGRIKTNFYADPHANHDFTGELLRSAAVDAVYGQRYVGEGPDIKVEKCDLDTLTKINEVISMKVLSGEHTHVPRALVPPEPAYSLSPDNNDFWLDQIGNHNTWPIMLHGKVINNQINERGKAARDIDQLEPDDHDETDFHPGNLATFPLEMQDEISEAARHTLAFRTAHPETRGPVSEASYKDVVVIGEDRDQDDPLAYNLRSNPTSPRYRSGINIIDDITDNESYMGFLGKLVAMPEEKAQATMAEYIKIADGVRSGEIDPNDSGLALEDKKRIEEALVINTQRAMIVDVTNFNIRHREGRRITPEEIKTAEDAYLKGILRVASKIRGDFEYPQAA